MKLTKRKSFSFYRSYYDVFNELSDDDKLLFIEALLDKQFLDEDPQDLKGMVKFAYISQMDSIEKQVKGYCDKTKTPLNIKKSYPWQGVASTPREQEKEKEKEKLINTYTKKEFLNDWNVIRTEVLKKPSHLNRLDFNSNNLLNEIIKDCDNASEIIPLSLKGFFKQTVFPNGQDYTTNVKHYLNHFNTYLQAYYDKNDKIYGTKKI